MSIASLNFPIITEELVQAQQSATNLTTFRAFPLPSRIVEVPYPLDMAGNPLNPAFLNAHSYSHKFETPLCFHAGECILFIAYNFYGNNENSVHYLCGKYGAVEQCPFHIDLDLLLFRRARMMFTYYGQRDDLSPGFRSGSIQSSGIGFSIPKSFSILFQVAHHGVHSVSSNVKPYCAHTMPGGTNTENLGCSRSHTQQYDDLNMGGRFSQGQDIEKNDELPSVTTDDSTLGSAPSRDVDMYIEKSFPIEGPMQASETVPVDELEMLFPFDHIFQDFRGTDDIEVLDEPLSAGDFPGNMPEGDIRCKRQKVVVFDEEVYPQHTIHRDVVLDAPNSIVWGGSVQG